MKTRRFDHIDLRVNDRKKADSFYRQLLPALGFEIDRSDEEWCAFYAPGEGATAFFGLTEKRDHQPNESRIAFWAESRAEVDRLSEIVRQAGGLNLEGPQIWTEYSAGYYALFFEDPSGNKLEICHRESRPVAV